MKGVFFSAEYSVEMKTQRPILYLFGRNESGRRIRVRIPNFMPYYWVEDQYRDIANNYPWVVLKEEERLPEFSQRISSLVKMYVRLPKHVKIAKESLLKRGITTYEADVLFPDRYLIDNGIHHGFEFDGKTIKPCDIDIPPRVGVLDIEVLGKGDVVPNPDEAKYPVMCLTFHDSYTGNYYVFYIANNNLREVKPLYKTIYTVCIDEVQLLEAVIDHIKTNNYDLLMGWNLYWDLRYLICRMRRKRIDPRDLAPLSVRLSREEDVRLRGRELMDALALYKRLILKELETAGKDATLDTVANNILGKGKKKLPYGVNMAKNWERVPMEVLEYNREDVDLTRGIIEETDMIDFMIAIKKLSGARWIHLFKETMIWDIIILRKVHNRFVLRNKPKEPKLPYEGAAVLDPIIGLHKNVVQYDFKELYPTVILAYNISPETCIGRMQYDKSKLGMLPSILKEWLEYRDKLREQLKVAVNKHKEREIKKLTTLDNALKSLINAGYGVFGYKGFRLYSYIMAEDITQLAKKMLLFIKDSLTEEPIYGDTDSLFVKFNEDLTKEKAKEVEKRLNDRLKDFITKEGLLREFKFNLSEIYDSYFLEAKKRYVGKCKWSEKGREYNWKGMEKVRSDQSEITNQVFTTVMKMILDFKEKNEIQEVIANAINKVKKKHNWRLMGIPFKAGIKPYIRRCSSKECRRTKPSMSIVRDENEIYYRCPMCGNKNKAHPNMRSVYYREKLFDMKIDYGTKYKLYYVKATTDRVSSHVNCIAIRDDEFMPRGYMVDYDEMIKKTIENKLKDIFKILKWDISFNVSVLDKYFG